MIKHRSYRERGEHTSVDVSQAREQRENKRKRKYTVPDTSVLYVRGIRKGCFQHYNPPIIERN